MSLEAQQAQKTGAGCRAKKHGICPLLGTGSLLHPAGTRECNGAEPGATSTFAKGNCLEPSSARQERKVKDGLFGRTMGGSRCEH
eukprot:2678560-Alexandrium_andersonii.AAC.1